MPECGYLCPKDNIVRTAIVRIEKTAIDLINPTVVVDKSFEKYGYYCDRCAAIKLHLTVGLNDHDLILEDEAADFYRLFIKYDRLIDEINIRKQRAYAQYQLIIKARDNYLESLRKFAAEFVALPANLAEYRRNPHEFDHNRIKIYGQKMDQILSSQLWSEDENDVNDGFYEHKGFIVHKSSNSTIPTTPEGFCYLFYITEMENPVKTRLKLSEKKYNEWSEKLLIWKKKKFKMFSVLENDQASAQGYFLRNRREVKEYGYTMEEKHPDNELRLPFHFDDKHMKRTCVKKGFKSDKARLRYIRTEFNKSFTDSSLIIHLSTNPPSCKNIPNSTLRHRDFDLPVISYMKAHNSSIARKAISSLIEHEIFNPDTQLTKISVTDEWQVGLACVGLLTKNVEKIEANFYRVAVKKFMSVDDNLELRSSKKFIVWCLDLDKRNIVWLSSIGNVYELPDCLSPKVWPFQAQHVWYSKKKHPGNCDPRHYFERMLDQNEYAKVNSESTKFVERWLAYSTYEVVLADSSKSSEKGWMSELCCFGDVVIRDGRKTEVQRLSVWWDNIQRSLREGLGENIQEVTKEESERLEKRLQPSPHHVQYQRVFDHETASSVLRKPVAFNHERALYTFIDENDISDNSNSQYNLFDKLERRLLLILSKYIFGNETFRDFIQQVKQCSTKYIATEEDLDRIFPQITSEEFSALFYLSKAEGTKSGCQSVGTKFKVSILRDRIGSVSESTSCQVLRKLLHDLTIPDSIPVKGALGRFNVIPKWIPKKENKKLKPEPVVKEIIEVVDMGTQRIVKVNGKMLNVKESHDYLRKKEGNRVVVTQEELDREEEEEKLNSRDHLQSLFSNTVADGTQATLTPEDLLRNAMV